MNWRDHRSVLSESAITQFLQTTHLEVRLLQHCALSTIATKEYCTQHNDCQYTLDYYTRLAIRPSGGSVECKRYRSHTQAQGDCLWHCALRSHIKKFKP